MFKIKKYIPDIVVAIILIAGIGLLAYPTIGDYINALHSSKAIGSYVEKTKDLSKEEKENLLREAREYNESLVGKVNRYYLNEEEKKRYAHILDITKTGIMAYVEIPKLNIYMAARKHKKNIAFLISLTGSNHTVICMAKYLREATETYVVGIAGPYHTELKKWCHEIVEIPNRDALLSLDVITSFSGATYILDIFFALLLSKRYEEHARSSMEMLNHLSLLWDETYHTKEKNE